jgi:hypothetical protein
LRWGKTRGKNEEKPAIFSVKKREKKALLAATEKAVSGPFGSFGKVANSPFGNEIDLLCPHVPSQAQKRLCTYVHPNEKTFFFHYRFLKRFYQFGNHTYSVILICSNEKKCHLQKKYSRNSELQLGTAQRMLQIFD